jgi:IclR family transcriptional regulator, KDG regulon repressor
LADILENLKFEKFTGNTIADKETLGKHLAQVRKNGFAMDQEEIEEGLSCIAAPIKNHRAKVIAGISVSGPTSRMQADISGALANDVIDTALQISRRLGYKG